MFVSLKHKFNKFQRPGMLGVLHHLKTAVNLLLTGQIENREKGFNLGN
jgi:hypothetical protein